VQLSLSLSSLARASAAALACKRLVCFAPENAQLCLVQCVELRYAFSSHTEVLLFFFFFSFVVVLI
jgi:hypothetical protein